VVKLPFYLANSGIYELNRIGSAVPGGLPWAELGADWMVLGGFGRLPLGGIAPGPSWGSAVPGSGFGLC